MFCWPRSRPSGSSRWTRSPAWRSTSPAMARPRSPAPTCRWTEDGRLLRLATMRAVLILALLPLAACAAVPQSLRSPVAGSTDWRQVATSADRARLRNWRTAFVKALDQARKAGHSAEIAREGRLLDPDAALGPV